MLWLTLNSFLEKVHRCPLLFQFNKMLLLFTGLMNLWKWNYFNRAFFYNQKFLLSSFFVRIVLQLRKIKDTARPINTNNKLTFLPNSQTEGLPIDPVVVWRESSLPCGIGGPSTMMTVILAAYFSWSWCYFTKGLSAEFLGRLAVYRPTSNARHL